jgi:hypothetical protein
MNVVSPGAVGSDVVLAVSATVGVAPIRETPLRVITVVVPTHGVDSLARTSVRLCAS